MSAVILGFVYAAKKWGLLANLPLHLLLALQPPDLHEISSEMLGKVAEVFAS